MPGSLKNDLGYWNQPIACKGAIEWTTPAKIGFLAGLQTHVAHIDGQPVAKVKKTLYGGYIVSIEGWMWTNLTEDSITAKLGIKESDVRSFDRLPSAKRAVVDAFALLS